jgi:transposase-like protein
MTTNQQITGMRGVYLVAAELSRLLLDLAILLNTVRIVLFGRDRLSGVIEVDETYIGGERPGKRGRGAAGKSLVLIAVEDKGNQIGRMRLRRIPDASAESLVGAVKESVEPGSVVRTDGWSGYGPLSAEGYEHVVVRKSAEVGENLLPLVNRGASLLKRWLLGTHQGGVRPSHLDYYLDEYTFRFNRRTSRSRGKLFFRLVQQAVSIAPLTKSDLRHGRNLSQPQYIVCT